MWSLLVAAFLKDLKEAQDVRRYIRIRSFEGVSNAGLCSEVDYAVETATIKQLIHSFRIGKRNANKLELALLLQQY